MITEYALWLENRSEKDNLDLFIERYFHDLDQKEINREMVYEFYLQAKAFGEVYESLTKIRDEINKLKEKVNGQKHEKSNEADSLCRVNAKKSGEKKPKAS